MATDRTERDQASDRFRQSDTLFDAALDLPDAERDAFVDAACANDEEFRRELRRLLGAYRRAEGFLEGSALEMARPLIVAIEGGAMHADAAPKRVGAFRIERELGRGGMGVVYLATRDDGQFEQRVALKLIRRSGATVVQRFLEERRILALLEHPRIARLVDGGVMANGMPYFAMEYVEGEPIDVYCAAHQLSIDQRIRLFISLCEGVQYAHQQLIVHRDLKPSNVLVARDGQLKLLDFGIAKLIDVDASDLRSHTGPDTRAFSIPFAAPEQIRGEPTTTGTDVYSSGVLLYTLLTGRHPFDFHGCTITEIERMICTVDPPRPSAAFVASEGRLASGDLDAIVMKAMHKEPARRYASAAAFAEDLERFLSGHPVIARPDSAWYRAQKFARRHRAGVVGATVLAIALPTVAVRERSLRAQSDSEARRATAVEQYLVGVFDVADPNVAGTTRGADVTVRELLDRGVTGVDSALAGQSDVQVEMQRVLGLVYMNLELFDRSEPLQRRVLERQRARLGDQHPAVADAMAQLGHTLSKLNRFDEADSLLRGALARRRALFGDRDTSTVVSLEHVAELSLQRSKYAAAESLYREDVALRRALIAHGETPGSSSTNVATALSNLAVVLTVRGNYVDAEPLLREALAIRFREFGPDHLQTVTTQLALGQALQQRGHYAEAETLYRRQVGVTRRVVGDRDPRLAAGLSNLSNMLARQMGRPDEAEPMAREALAIYRERFGERHNFVVSSLDNLGAVLRAKGDLGGAESAFQQSMDMSRSINGPDHRNTARAFANLAGVRHIRGDSVGVIALLRESRAQLERQLGAHASSVVTATLYLGQHTRERGHAAEADSIFRGLMSWLDTTAAPERTQFHSAQLGLGQSLIDRKRIGEAIPLIDAALASRLAEFGANDWRTAEARISLGAAHLARGDVQRAEPLVREANIVLQRQRRIQPRIARQAETLARRVVVAQ